MNRAGTDWGLLSGADLEQICVGTLSEQDMEALREEKDLSLSVEVEGVGKVR